MTFPTRSKSLHKGAASDPYSDDALEATNEALESTRQFASQAFEKASEKMRDLRHGMRDLASKGASTVGDATVAAQKQLGRYADTTRRYIADEPVKAALIAAAVGAVVVALVLAMRRNRRY